MNSTLRKTRGRDAFTLVEMLFGVAIFVSVMAALTVLLLIFARGTYKNAIIADSTAETRRVQEHLNRELSSAITQRDEADPTQSIRPRFSDPSDTSPIRYGRLDYRTAIGPYATSQGTTPSTSTTIVLSCPADLQPQVGDWLVIESPDIGRGIRITGVSDSRSAGQTGAVTLTLAQAITAGAVIPDTVAVIQRESAYETVAPTSGANVTELRWYPTTATTDYIVLSTHVDAASRFLFAQTPEDDTAAEVTVSWQFTYRVDDRSARSVPGNTSFLERNFATGLIFPKSGNPLAMAPISGISTSISTTSTSTTSTSTSTTSTSTSTSTTSTSTSTSSISTSKSTSTSTSSTKSTSASTTSSTKTTSASTTSTSTTSKSTTSTTKTTSASTTSASTTKSTTTSTTATTSKSTTSTSTTSTTSASTTKSTTSSTTASTSKSTTTTSSVPTTSTTSSTSTASTSTIPFDG